MYCRSEHMLCTACLRMSCAALIACAVHNVLIWACSKEVGGKLWTACLCTCCVLPV